MYTSITAYVHACTSVAAYVPTCMLSVRLVAIYRAGYVTARSGCGADDGVGQDAAETGCLSGCLRSAQRITVSPEDVGTTQTPAYHDHSGVSSRRFNLQHA